MGTLMFAYVRCRDAQYLVKRVLGRLRYYQWLFCAANVPA